MNFQSQWLFSAILLLVALQSLEKPSVVFKVTVSANHWLPTFALLETSNWGFAFRHSYLKIQSFPWKPSILLSPRHTSLHPEPVEVTWDLSSGRVLEFYFHFPLNTPIKLKHTHALKCPNKRCSAFEMADIWYDIFLTFRKMPMMVAIECHLDWVRHHPGGTPLGTPLRDDQVSLSLSMLGRDYLD